MTGSGTGATTRGHTRELPLAHTCAGLPCAHCRIAQHRSQHLWRAEGAGICNPRGSRTEGHTTALRGVGYCGTRQGVPRFRILMQTCLRSKPRLTRPSHPRHDPSPRYPHTPPNRYTGTPPARTAHPGTKPPNRPTQPKHPTTRTAEPNPTHHLSPNTPSPPANPPVSPPKPDPSHNPPSPTPVLPRQAPAPSGSRQTGPAIPDPVSEHAHTPPPTSPKPPVARYAARENPAPVASRPRVPR